MKLNLKNKLKSFFTIPKEDLEEEPSPKFGKVNLFNLTKNKLFFGILAFLLLINILVGLDINQFYIRAILSFIFLITIPGLLIMLMLKIREIGFWEYLVYVIGLSVSFIMFGGLAVNWILPLLNITDEPLSLWPILICFNIFLIVFWIIAYIRNKKLSLEIKSPKLDLTNRIFFIVPMLFPVLSILGAFLLNNHGTNILTMIMLGGIAVYVLLLTIFRKRLNENVFPWGILFIAIAILLMTSLRSWFVSGVDTNSELSILNSIIKIQFWSPEIFRGAYGSMLALTILPSIFYSITSINPHFILKFAEVFIYALTPIIVYLLFKEKSKILSFFAAFFFMSQPMFISWYSIPIRQQIAFLFFGLMLLIIFRENINTNARKLFFIIFGFSMAVSHYSTTYIALAIFLLVYVFSLIYQKYEKIKKKKDKLKHKKTNVYFLTFGLILLLFIFGFLWYSQATSTSNGINYFLKNSFSNLGDLFNEDLQAPGHSILEQFSISSKKSMSNLLDEYLLEISEESTESGGFLFQNSYKPRIKIPQGILLTPLGQFKFLHDSKKIFEILGKVLFIIGFFYLIYCFKKDGENKKEKVLAFTFYTLVGFIILLPFISVNYDTSRIFQQSLFLTSFYSVSGFLCIFLFFNKKLKLVLLFFIFYFLIFSGFYAQLIGGPDVSLVLNNIGLSYSKFYTHKPDIISTNWFFLNNNKNKIYVGSHSYGKMLLSENCSSNRISSDIYSGLVLKSYIYSSYNNKNFGVYTKSFNNIALYLNFPTEFLNKNKNKVYNNGGSEIFK
ncbi:DUF2206 domain-containing protein [Candidatus Pacearchaeota archaeon]|nr:DUF2206 domain-containing protein [Candidatus Pacearchaeota archaeon]